MTASTTTAVWQPYLKMCKVRVILLMLITAWVGMCLATPAGQMVPMRAWLAGTIGIALGAAAGAVINHILDQRQDAVMQRTQHRPLVKGTVGTKQAVIFAIVLVLASMCTLIRWVNGLTAILTMLSMVGYAFVYTGWLKHLTSQNIVIGGIAGAMPPLLGWVAVTDYIDPAALTLVTIIFVWTPPHFWALAIDRYDDYKAAGIPMLPVSHGIAFTKFCIVSYTILLLAVSMMPFIVNLSGWFYLIVANLLGLGFCALAIWLKCVESRWLARLVFRYSIVYLTVLFAALLVDHYLPWSFHT